MFEIVRVILMTVLTLVGLFLLYVGEPIFAIVPGVIVITLGLISIVAGEDVS